MSKSSVFFASIKNIIKNAITNNYTGMASEMAYNFILSLFPFAIFLTAIFGFLGTTDIISLLINSLRVIAPEETLSLIEKVLKDITNVSSGKLVTFGLLGALWSGSGAIKVIMDALNKAYHVEETRSFWKTNILSIAIELMLTLIIIISVNLIVFGKVILGLLYKYVYFSNDIIVFVSFIRWPIAFLTLFSALLIIYYFLPNISIKNKKVHFLSSIPGALFFCIAWLISSWLFSIYVNNFGKYNLVYGALGAVIILLIWLYFTALIILIGGEINSEVYSRIKVKSNNY